MRIKSHHIITLFLIIYPIFAQAQTDSTYQHAFQIFKEQIFKDYKDFRTQAYDNFERFLSEAWDEYQSVAGKESVYSLNKPENLSSLKTSSGNSNSKDAVRYRVEPITNRNALSSNKGVVVNPSDPDAVIVDFYGCKIGFHVPYALRYTAKGYKESDISKYHKAMRSNEAATKNLQEELDATVDRMGLNDWGYFTLLRCISEKVFEKPNDRVLFCFYMLHSQGFKARVGRGQKSGQLLLLLALDNSKEVYSLTFFRINGTKFYVVYGNGQKGENAYSYDEKADATGLKDIGLDFKHTLDIADCDKKRIIHLNKAGLDLELPFSSSHLRYYDEMPLTVFPIYFNTSVSKESNKILSEAFQSLSKNHSKAQLVDIMLYFVQTAFDYKIDEIQFGREKYFFPEEVIGRPFSDCEDRCALFAWLVRQYTGYEVVGVLYPDHLATAVCFGTDKAPEWKSFIHNGKHYVICDPTYEEASIGTVMPKYINTKYEILEMK